MTEQAPAAGDELEGEVVSGGRSRWVRRVIVLASVSVVLGVLVVAAGAFAFWSIYDDATIPSPDALAIPDPSIIQDRHEDTLATLEPAAVRRNRALDDLPEHVPQAVIAAEDRNFYGHAGVSPRGVVRAAWANLTRGERVQGASTIPQQYVELAISEIPDTYLGKFREAATAVRLDRELPKDQILENYLNAVPWGRQAYGIEAAARTYFDVAATELDLHQAAVLAGMIAAPTAFDPARNPDAAAARRDFVLEGMVETEAISRARADELIGTELPPLRDRPLVSFGEEAYFIDAVEREVARLLEQLEDDRDPSVGLRIATTYDPRAQRLAVNHLNATLDGTDHSGSVVSIDHDGGAVRALVGGRDYAEQQYNVAIERQSLRSPGSAFKTFALAAFVEDGFDPDATRLDGPNDITIEIEGGDDYEPKNFGDQSFRNITVREATVRSVNTAYVTLAEELGFERVTDMARTLGIDTELAPVPSAVLGSQGVTPLEMAEAYGTLAAGGVHHDPFIISSITTHQGEVIYEHEVAGEEVIDPNTAAVVTDVLQDVVTSGTGTAAATRHPTAGKTGTTNDSRDAWFVGYTPEVTTAVWVGNLDNSSMGGVTGGSLPAAVFGAYVDDLVGDEEPGSFPTPDRSGLQRSQDLRPAPPPPPPPPPPSPDDGDDERDEDGEDSETDADADGADGDGEDGDGEDGTDGSDDGTDGSDDGTDGSDDGTSDDGTGDDGGDNGSTDGSGDDGDEGGTDGGGDDGGGDGSADGDSTDGDSTDGGGGGGGGDDSGGDSDGSGGAGSGAGQAPPSDGGQDPEVRT